MRPYKAKEPQLRNKFIIKFDVLIWCKSAPVS